MEDIRLVGENIKSRIVDAIMSDTTVMYGPLEMKEYLRDATSRYLLKIYILGSQSNCLKGGSYTCQWSYYVC